MNKKNLYLIIGVLLGVSVLFNTVQFAVSYFKNKKIKTLTTEVSIKEKAVIELTDSNSRLENNVLELSEENIELKEKIAELNRRIKRLQYQLRKSSDKVKGIEKAITYLKEREANLVEQVAFGASRMADELPNQEVIKEQKRLQHKIVLLENKSDSLVRIKDSLYQEIAEKESERLKFMRKEAFTQDIFDIIQSAEVEFFEILPRKQNQKKARSAKKWYDTVLNFSITYNDQGGLEGKDFLVRIMNTSTQQIIVPRDKDSVMFTFDSNPVSTINYVNAKEKEKGNYVVQVFLLKNTEAYLLNNGTAAIDF